MNVMDGKEVKVEETAREVLVRCKLLKGKRVDG